MRGIQLMRKIPDDNLAYPVLITDSDGRSGTGFLLNSSLSIYLVTAMHVLYKVDDGTFRDVDVQLSSCSRDPAEHDRQILSASLRELHENDHMFAHSSADVAIARITEPCGTDEGQRNRLLPEITKISATRAGIVGIGMNTVKQYDEILVGNEVIVFGYPTSLGLKHMPQFDYERPLLRSGLVAGLNRQQQTMVLDCPVYPGNSGGPVIEIEVGRLECRYRLIGVLTQFVPVEESWLNMTFSYSNITLTNSGYSIAVPMDYVLELVNEAEATKGEGQDSPAAGDAV